MTAFIERIYNLVRLVCVFRSFTSCASSMAATRPRDRNTNGNRNTVHRRQQQRPPIGMEPTLADVLSNLKAHRERQRQRQRQLQTANVNEFLLDDEAIYNSSNTTSSTHNNDEEAGIVSSPYQDCICKGAELLPEKVTTMPLFFGNATCSEIQESILPLMITVDQCGYSDIAGALFAQCCTTFYNRPRYQCENTIHQQIITQNDENNVNVPPIVENGRPVIVRTDLIFEDFGKIDVILGTAEIVMSIGMVWHDPRLAWTITNDTCADYVSVYAGFDAETTQIWVPDLDLANMKSGVQHWASVPADVFSYVLYFPLFSFEELLSSHTSKDGHFILSTFLLLLEQIIVFKTTFVRFVHSVLIFPTYFPNMQTKVMVRSHGDTSKLHICMLCVYSFLLVDTTVP